MKAGRKRLYGIPLIFKTFEELCEVEEITIQWNIYEYCDLKSDCSRDSADYKPFDVHAIRLDVVYHLSFEKDEFISDYRFFIVFSKDDILTLYGNTKECHKEDYYDGFDIALLMQGTIESYPLDNEYFTYFLDGDTVDLRLQK